MWFKPIRTKNDKFEDEVENVFKTYREVIDKKMEKVPLSHMKRRPRENHDFSMWLAEEKH